jgi:hypothetical protein
MFIFIMERDFLGDLDMNDRVILKMVLRDLGHEDINWTEPAPIPSCCDDVHEPS